MTMIAKYLMPAALMSLAWHGQTDRGVADGAGILRREAIARVTMLLAEDVCGENTCFSGNPKCLTGDHTIQNGGPEPNTDDHNHLCAADGFPPFGHSCDSHQCLFEEDAELLASASVDEMVFMLESMPEHVVFNRQRRNLQILGCAHAVVAQFAIPESDLDRVAMSAG